MKIGAENAKKEKASCSEKAENSKKKAVKE